jgi:dTDP-D-glucose 4,6-dehydratase
MVGKKRDEHDDEHGLPQFVRDRRAKDDRTAARRDKLNRTQGSKATNQDGNKGKR